jgi:hypothetical protein
MRSIFWDSGIDMNNDATTTTTQPSSPRHPAIRAIFTLLPWCFI